MLPCQLVHQRQQHAGHADAQQKSALLAAGISTAMNATMLGLAVAIPCMVAFSFLMNRTNQLTSDIEQSAVRAMDILKQRYYAAEFDALSDAQAGAPVGVATSGTHGKVTPLRRAA